MRTNLVDIGRAGRSELSLSGAQSASVVVFTAITCECL